MRSGQILYFYVTLHHHDNVINNFWIYTLVDVGESFNK